MESKQAGRWNINNGLRRFNLWFDEFVMALAKPLALLGFAMGTTDIFTRGGLATEGWFAFAWAAIQAATIDGLFFTVWYRVFTLKWQRGNWRQITAHLFIGAILAVVAGATNDILGFQQLWGLSDSQSALVRLGIDPQQFTTLRAVLVVTVAIMVAYVYSVSSRVSASSQNERVSLSEHPSRQIHEPSEPTRESVSTSEPTQTDATEPPNEPNEPPVSQSEPVSPSESAHMDEMSLNEPLTDETPLAREPDEPDSMDEVSQDESDTEPLSRPLVLPSREVVMETIRQQPGMKLKQFAREVGIPYSTITRWVREANRTETATD